MIEHIIKTVLSHLLFSTGNLPTGYSQLQGRQPACERKIPIE